jgi:hypothetical protein
MSHCHRSCNAYHLIAELTLQADMTGTLVDVNPRSISRTAVNIPTQLIPQLIEGSGRPSSTSITPLESSLVAADDDGRATSSWSHDRFELFFRRPSSGSRVSVQAFSHDPSKLGDRGHHLASAIFTTDSQGVFSGILEARSEQFGNTTIGQALRLRVKLVSPNRSNVNGSTDLTGNFASDATPHSRQVTIKPDSRSAQQHDGERSRSEDEAIESQPDGDEDTVIHHIESDGGVRVISDIVSSML